MAQLDTLAREDRKEIVSEEDARGYSHCRMEAKRDAVKPESSAAPYKNPYRVN